MPKSNAEIAVELQSKFELFFLGLIFAVLSLSIQTSQFGRSDVTDGFELLGWVSLLAAAFSGLLRGEWSPVAFQIFDKRASVEKKIDYIGAQLAQGITEPVTFVDDGKEEQVPAPDGLARLNGVLVQLEQQTRDLDARLRFRYQAMKWGFFIGVISLVVSRGYLPTKALCLKLVCNWLGC